MTALTSPPGEPEPPDPTKLAIVEGWLVYETGEHNCGTDSSGYYGAHERNCGLEALMSVEDLSALLDAVSAAGMFINRVPEQLPKLLAGEPL